MEPLEPPVKEEGETQEEGSPQNKEQTLFYVVITPPLELISK